MKVIITGPAASGKTTLAEAHRRNGVSVAKAMTTRPKRSEQDTEYEFCIADSLKETCEIYHVYNGWYYGYTDMQLCFNEVFIAGAEMAIKLKEWFLKHQAPCIIIYLCAPANIREMRLNMRNMPGDTVSERMKRDYRDYALFEQQGQYDIKIESFEVPDYAER